ncbi:MAG: endonuclease DNA-(apurinic or apyrimidinic site) lyase [Thermoleophilia bacterium]|nr:endonuclease DNA-(apurinic or apyrimidinic site) lyase [Thermoleophilia bacterium]
MSRQEPLPPLRGERVAARRVRSAELMAAMQDAYPDAHCALDFETPFQLLVATILSAQCTDARVNLATPALFAAYPTALTMAQAPLAHLEELVQSTGFFRQKAKNLRATAQRLTDEYGGVLPHTIEELTTLPGAARKTANVVISVCFPEHAAGIAVDTHVQRVARRLGMVRSWEPHKIESDLMNLLPRDLWNVVTMLMIDHGREVCRAPKPLCALCPPAIASRCPSRERWMG